MDQAAVQRERHWAPRVLVLTVLAFALIFVGQAVQASAVGGAETDTEVLISRADAADTALIGAAVSALGLALLLAPILFLFDAARARGNPQMSRFRALVILGPILMGVSTLLTAIALDSVASDFVAGTPTLGDAAEQRADDLVADSGLFMVAGGVSLAGLMALVFGLVYSARTAMRVGLVTRFWGTLGMAFGVLTLVGAVVGSSLGLIGSVFFLVHVALVANARWFGAQPPAWAAGKAVPWPDPGDPDQSVSSPDLGDEPARPEDFEGSGTEIDRERPGRRDNKRKRKRKQRGQ